jgi:hypothetical protein
VDEEVAEGAEEEAGDDDKLYSRTFTVCIFCVRLLHTERTI